MANTVPGSGLVILDCLIVLNNQQSDNTGYIAYHNNNTGTGAATNSQLLGISKYGCGQYMMWEDKGMRIGMRSIGNAGLGELYFTTCNDTTQMVIKNSGNVGIGLTTPCGALDVYKAGSGGTGTGDNLIARGGNNNNTFGSNQLRLGYAGGTGYSHAIKTRHNSGGNTDNALDFFLWTTADCTETVGSKNVMTLTGCGAVGIGACYPNILGFTGTMLTVNGRGNYQGLELAVCGTARMTMLANIEGTLGYISTRQAGMSLIFEAGAAQERMRITCCGNVGIGTSSPRFSLDVAGGAISNFYMSCCAATVDGIGPYDYGIIGSGNGAGAILINDIVGARYSVAAGSYNLTFRKSVRNTVGACVYCTVMTFVGTTDTNCVPNVNIENSLGIGTASPSYRLHVNGTFYAAGSSQDYKQSICNYNTDSCMFMKLKPVTYQYKDEWCHLGKELKSETQIGLIAEDVAEVYPELAILVNEAENKVVRNVDYEKLSIILLSEVQKLRREVDDLKHK